MEPQFLSNPSLTTLKDLQDFFNFANAPGQPAELFCLLGQIGRKFSKEYEEWKELTLDILSQTFQTRVLYEGSYCI